MSEAPCPLCGGPLKDAVTACSRCPMGSGCGMLCCENCGYETVAPRSQIVDLFKRIFGRKTRPGEVKPNGT